MIFIPQGSEILPPKKWVTQVHATTPGFEPVSIFAGLIVDGTNKSFTG